MRYIGSYDLTINRIEVFSCSNLAVPYYHFTNPDGKRLVIGGMRIGHLKDMDNPLFEARYAERFMVPLAYGMTDGYEHCKAYHMVVADSGEINGRVLIDRYDDNTIGVGASNCLYEKDKDGNPVLLFDGIEIEKLNNDWKRRC